MHKNTINNNSEEKSESSRRSRSQQRPKSRKNPPAKKKKPVYGVIDLGTNNCRLLVAVQHNDGFRVIDSFSRIVRLGEGFRTKKTISDQAIERTIAALQICVEKMKRRNVTHMWNVATQACREASNGKDFVKTVEKTVKINLDIIDPSDEARLAVMGCKALLDTKHNRGIIFDIGGGSTEIIWIEFNHNKMPKIIDWISIPLGVVNLSEEYGTTHALPDAHYQEMKNRVKDHIVPFEDKHNIKEYILENRVQLMGTSGTVTTLTSMFLNQAIYDRSEVDGAWMKTGDLVHICKDLSKMSFEERLALNNIGNDRAELVVAGCAILDAIVDIWPIDDVRVADRGIREGMLHQLMDQQRNTSNPNKRKRNRKRYYLKRNKQQAAGASNQNGTKA